MKLIYLKSALKCDSFDVAIGAKIPFFRLLVTIEPGSSLLQFVTTNCLINTRIIVHFTIPPKIHLPVTKGEDKQVTHSEKETYIKIKNQKLNKLNTLN